MPGFVGATNVFDVPAKTGSVLNEPSAAETVCAVSSALCTVTVAPAFTVIGAPNAKSLIVMVDADAPVALGDGVARTDVGADVGAAPEDAFELEPQLTAKTAMRATVAIATATDRE